MPRMQFTSEMALKVENLSKKATTRYSMHDVGIYDAIKGDRYHPVKFARIYIYEVRKTTWQDVIDNHYIEEGFRSPIAMVAFLKKKKLVKGDINDKVYFHRFVKYVERMR